MGRSVWMSSSVCMPAASATAAAAPSGGAPKRAAGKPQGTCGCGRMCRDGSRPRLVAVSAVAPHPSASFSATLRVHLDDPPGAFARLAAAIGDAGGSLGAIDLVRVERGKKIRDVVVLAADEHHIAQIVEAVRALDGIDVEHVSDRTLLLHLGGKLEVTPRIPLKTRDDLSMAYTPGVARVCRAIADDPDAV